MNQVIITENIMESLYSINTTEIREKIMGVNDIVTSIMALLKLEDRRRHYEAIDGANDRLLSKRIDKLANKNIRRKQTAFMIKALANSMSTSAVSNNSQIPTPKGKKKGPRKLPAAQGQSAQNVAAISRQSPLFMVPSAPPLLQSTGNTLAANLEEDNTMDTGILFDDPEPYDD
jgi:hypothetical protein